ncbi:MAG: M50 family metallopeptidase [Candidatus Omnitrophica bacterium]|nr:M50 family metallopeptidase [Candidatus Omnitrophota bacterium]
MSLLTLWSFLFTGIGDTWAVDNPSGLPGGGPDRTVLRQAQDGPEQSRRAGSPGTLIKQLNVKTFSLPEQLGRIKDSWQSSESSTIIHIQDAHCNYAAQHKIAEIAGYLNKEYGIKVINIEGGAREYDLKVFTDISDALVRARTADFFVKQGQINGAEFFAATNPEKAVLWGIEDENLYLDNLAIYRESLGYKDTVDRHLNALTHILDTLKGKIYSPELLELDNKYALYKAETVSFKDYVAYLIRAAENKAIAVRNFTNIYLLSQTLRAEETIDFRAADSQRDDLIKALEGKLSKKELEELVAKTVEFKAETISQKDFYTYLVAKVGRAGIALKNFPEFQKYVVYISLYNAIDKPTVMEEMERLENAVKETLYRNDTERELNKLSKDLAILKNVFNVTLTRDDYQYYRANEEAFRMTHYVSFINKYSPLFKITATLDDTVTDLDGLREKMTRFFECSFLRDEAFLRNMRFSYNGKTPPVPLVNKEGECGGVGQTAILVTGGFHTENLCELFKKNNVSYISIIPNFKNDAGYNCPYFDLLAGKGPAVDARLMTFLTSSLAIASIINRLGAKVDGPAARQLLEVKVALEAEIDWDKAKGLAVLANGANKIVVDRELNVRDDIPADNVSLTYDMASLMKRLPGRAPADKEERIKEIMERNGLKSIDIAPEDTGMVPQEIMAIFEIAEAENMDVVAISGGTARDFAIATRQGSKKLSFPVTTDYDVIILLPKGHEDEVYNEEAYLQLETRLKERLIAMGYAQGFVNGLILDFLPGTWVQDNYLFENLLASDEGNAFSISRLAVAKIGGKYRIFGRQDALDDRRDGMLRLYISKDSTPGVRMTAKMIGKAGIYKEIAGFTLDENIRRKMHVDMESLKAAADPDAAIAEFMQDIFQHIQLTGKGDKPEARLSLMIDDLEMEKIFGKSKEALIAHAVAASNRREHVPVLPEGATPERQRSPIETMLEPAVLSPILLMGIEGGIGGLAFGVAVIVMTLSLHELFHFLPARYLFKATDMKLVFGRPINLVGKAERKGIIMNLLGHVPTLGVKSKYVGVMTTPNWRLKRFVVGAAGPLSHVILMALLIGGLFIIPGQLFYLRIGIGYWMFKNILIALVVSIDDIKGIMRRSFTPAKFYEDWLNAVLRAEIKEALPDADSTDEELDGIVDINVLRRTMENKKYLELAEYNILKDKVIDKARTILETRNRYTVAEGNVGAEPALGRGVLSTAAAAPLAPAGAGIMPSGPVVEGMPFVAGEKELLKKLYRNRTNERVLRMITSWLTGRPDGTITGAQIEKRFKDLAFKKAEYIGNKDADQHGIMYEFDLRKGAGTERVIFIVYVNDGKPASAAVRWGDLADTQGKGKFFYQLPDHCLADVAGQLEISRKEPIADSRYELYLPWVTGQDDKMKFEEQLNDTPLVKDFVLSQLRRNDFNPEIAGRWIFVENEKAGAYHFRRTIVRHPRVSVDMMATFIHEFGHEMYSRLSEEKKLEVARYFKAEHPELIRLFRKETIYEGKFWSYGTEALAFCLEMAFNKGLARDIDGVWIFSKVEDLDFLIRLGIIDEATKKTIMEQYRSLGSIDSMISAALTLHDLSPADEYRLRAAHAGFKGLPEPVSFGAVTRTLEAENFRNDVRELADRGTIRGQSLTKEEILAFLLDKNNADRMDITELLTILIYWVDHIRENDGVMKKILYNIPPALLLEVCANDELDPQGFLTREVMFNLARILKEHPDADFRAHYEVMQNVWDRFQLNTVQGRQLLESDRKGMFAKLRTEFSGQDRSGRLLASPMPAPPIVSPVVIAAAGIRSGLAQDDAALL